jgi:hypothetical protein
MQVYCVVMTLAQTTIETTARYDLLVNALNTMPDLRSGDANTLDLNPVLVLALASRSRSSLGARLHISEQRD